VSDEELAKAAEMLAAKQVEITLSPLCPGEVMLRAGRSPHYAKRLTIPEAEGLAALLTEAAAEAAAAKPIQDEFPQE
jgi:hypothetical protein